MKKEYSLLFFIGIIFLLPFEAFAQKQEGAAAIFGRTVDLEAVHETGGVLNCGSTEYEMYLQEKYPQRFSTEEFEAWLAPKIERYKKTQLQEKTMSEVITIPVVVHIIHNNKPYGVDENITDEQILSQITVLNQDFRREVDTPGFNDNPVGADIEIEFCLAQRTPNGEATNGINRVSMAPPLGLGWFIDSVDEQIKPATIWSPEEYLNIWVVDEMNLFGVVVLAGYAQFPTDSGLPGLDEGSGTAAETDGVVVAHGYFGSAALYPQGNYVSSEVGGRTATHEVGHWLGLRHIWGDSADCDIDDYCDDTPPATAQNQVCEPNFSCGEYNMIENYMDYTPDTCMNIFTEDQKTRMRTVMQYATRRASLLNSQGCEPAPTYGFDAELKITTLNHMECLSDIAPEITLTNLGTQQNITSAVISYQIEGEGIQTYNWSGNLSEGDVANIELGTISVAPGLHQFTVSLTSINEEDSDEFTYNDTDTRDFNIASSYNTTQVTLDLTTDNWGGETVWVLMSGEETLYQGSNYPANHTITQTFNLQSDKCYAFTIFDLVGDGICCDYGTGSYSLTTANGQTIVSGGEFGLSETTTFILGALSSETYQYFNTVTLYPNPTTGILNIAIGNGSEFPENYVIYNALGQIVKSGKTRTTSDLSIDTSSFTDGIYFIKINREDRTKTLRFIKQ